MAGHREEAAGLAFLARAGEVLSASLEWEETLEHVARLAVPEIADWVFVEILQEDGSIDRMAVAHADPAKEALVREFARRYPLDPKSPVGSPKVIRTGEPELMSEIPDEFLEQAAEDEDHLRILREVGFCSAMIVPLTARGRTFGDLALAAAESGHTFDEEDLAFAQALASRCALAVDNARLYRDAQAAARVRRRQALEVNDRIVQRLSVAKYALERTTGPDPRMAIHEALEAARDLVDALLEDIEAETGEVKPGDVRQAD